MEIGSTWKYREYRRLPLLSGMHIKRIGGIGESYKESPRGSATPRFGHPAGRPPREKTHRGSTGLRVCRPAGRSTKRWVPSGSTFSNKDDNNDAGDDDVDDDGA